MTPGKFICTLSVFLGMVAGAVALVVIRVPDHIWWLNDKSIPVAGTFLFLWLVMNVFLPLATALALSVAAHGFWGVASALCDSVRRVVKRVRDAEMN